LNNILHFVDFLNRGEYDLGVIEFTICFFECDLLKFLTSVLSVIEFRIQEVKDFENTRKTDRAECPAES
jgi:hypothetical protein